MTHLATSRYSFSVPVREGSVLFNARTGAVIFLRGKDAKHLCDTLASPAARLEVEQLPPAIAPALLEGGFVSSASFDELADIRTAYMKARGDAPVVLTLTTTQDCNLGCYYCYEERTTDALAVASVPAIVRLAKDRLRRRNKRSLHVDWYGGEPLLNLEFLEAASSALQAMCESEGYTYSASIISNGTTWPAAVGEFLARHRIRQVQVSFDGMEKAHTRRRRYRSGHEQTDSSFERSVALVDQLLDHVRVDLRFNVDNMNQGDLLKFIDMARGKGWFARRHPAVVQPARLAAYSERSAFMSRTQLDLAQFDRLRDSVRAALVGETQVEESEAPDGAAFPRTYVCAALAHDSVVVGAESRLYRCGLQVGEIHRSVGQLGERRHLPLLGKHADETFWAAFDPTSAPNCSRCSFLPMCWGGCPKKHLEGDEHALHEQSLYWRKNLPRLIAARVGADVQPGFMLSEADQFRSP